MRDGSPMAAVYELRIEDAKPSTDKLGATQDGVVHWSRPEPLSSMVRPVSRYLAEAAQ